MADYEIVNDYMVAHYPHNLFAMQEANDCIWVSMGRVDMYFILRNGKIVDIQVD